MSNFFIAGLPRSRTAWFAAYLSAHPSVKCFHEGLKGCREPEDFFRKMQPYSPSVKIGNSDSGLPLMDIETYFPDAPVVVIRRPMTDSFHSTLDALGVTNPTNAMLDMFARLNERLCQMNGLHVDYEEIDERMPLIHAHLDIPYRKGRHDTFRKLHIETTDLSANGDALAWLPYAP